MKKPRASTRSGAPREPLPKPTLQREIELRAQGFSNIIGVDEAGRGPLAGPVVAAAIALPPNFDAALFPTLTDSKQVKESERESLFARLTTLYVYGVGIVDAKTVDEINIRQASWRAMQLAVENLQSKSAASTRGASSDFVLIDGLPYGAGPFPYEAIIKGDAKSLSIAAASVIAKVTRDALMREYSQQFPGYGFERHKGYGSPQHLQTLHEFGVCSLHRKTFAPVRRILEAETDDANSL